MKASAAYSWVSKPLANPALRTAANGVGVQSTVLTLLARDGLIEPFDFMMFADTHLEPRAVYEHLRWLQSPNMALPFPIYEVSSGDLGADLLASAASWREIGGHSAERSTWKQALRVANPPFFTRGPRTVEKSVFVEAMPLLGLPAETVTIIIERHTESETFGMLRRGCTRDYKINPMNSAIRHHLGLAPGASGPSSPIVELSIGLTTDELERVTTSEIPFIHHRYPLIELGLSKGDCVQYLLQRGLPIPIKSRCIICPYQTNELWLELATKSRDEFEQACQFDEAIRDGVRGTKTLLFLHGSRTPLRLVDLSVPDGLWSRDGLAAECQGVCGL